MSSFLFWTKMCSNQTSIARLIVKQKQAIRIINGANYRVHTSPLFHRLQILPVDKLITYYRTKFMHSDVHNKLPPSFANVWIANNVRKPNIALRNIEDLYVPPHRIEIVKRMPLCSFPDAWNTAPGDKQNPDQNLYLKELKNYLLQSYYKQAQ